jgi:hypothetical protein
VERFRPGEACPGREALRNRPDRCRVRPAGTPSAGAAPARPAAHDRPAGGARRDLRSAAHRLPVAAPAPGLAAARHGVRLLAALVAGRDAARAVLRPAGPGTAGGRPAVRAGRGKRRPAISAVVSRQCRSRRIILRQPSPIRPAGFRGREERSTRPTELSTRSRASHLRTVLTLMPKLAAAAAPVQPPRMRTTRRARL